MNEISGNLLAKQAIADAAASVVRDGMRVGIGTGSTSELFVRALAKRAREENLNLRCTASSKRSEALAADLDLNIVSMRDLEELDLAVISGDEFDREMRVMMGQNSALLNDKIIAKTAQRTVVIMDENKEVAWLGDVPLAVELVPMGARATRHSIQEALIAAKLLNKNMTLRMSADVPYVTENGHLILDLHLGRIPDPAALAHSLAEIPGVVAHGFLLGLVDLILIGYPDGRVDVRKR